MIIEYMLWKESDGIRTPPWIENGGYFFNPEDNTYIGWSPDLSYDTLETSFYHREYYIPDEVRVLKFNDLLERQTKIGMRNIDGKELSVKEISKQLKEWVKSIEKQFSDDIYNRNKIRQKAIKDAGGDPSFYPLNREEALDTLIKLRQMGSEMQAFSVLKDKNGDLLTGDDIVPILTQWLKEGKLKEKYDKFVSDGLKRLGL